MYTSKYKIIEVIMIVFIFFFYQIENIKSILYFKEVHFARRMSVEIEPFRLLYKILLQVDLLHLKAMIKSLQLKKINS